MNQLVIAKPSFWQRLKLAAQVFRAPVLKPVVELQNGMKLDLQTGQLIIPGEFNIHATGTLRLTSDEHVIIQSSRQPEDRPGYRYSVWLNPDLDDMGRPLMDEKPLLEDHSDECHSRRIDQK